MPVYSYVQWAMGSPASNGLGMSNQCSEEEGTGEEVEEEVMMEIAPSVLPSHCQATFHIAKPAPLRELPVATIRRYFGVPDIASSLTNYLTTLAITHPHPNLRTTVS